MFPSAHRALVDQGADFLNTKERFLDFLRQDEGQGLYDKKIQSMVDNKLTRLIVNINDLRLFDVKLTQRLLKLPTQVIPPFEEALDEYIQSKPHLMPDKQQKTTLSYHIGFEGSFGSHLVTPRQLGASYLKRLVCLEGIVTRCSLVRPKVVVSRHWCEATGKQYSRQYHDATSLSAPPTIVNYPTHDENGNVLSTEYGLSSYKDHQMICVQEMPERAPAGQLPVSVDVLLDHDLVDLMKPGDRLHIMGVYRAIPAKMGAFYRTVLIANHVRLISQDEQSSTMTAQDIKMIKQHAKDKNIFSLLAQSVAPSIYGHINIKKAILLMLLGGREHNLANGTHLRGDINILLIGDPSTAKSQLLRFVLNIAPLAINTTGKGASGVGLTAAVSSDKETGERVLEAGACVLADRGIVCIDEFDKMSEDDRVSIHEVMEQQTVTVSKAGIHTTLNARCSVLAAANPVYGQYNREKKPTENIGLPDSLLSRFDLLFIVLDNFDPTHDRRIGGHVLRMHRYRNEDSQGPHDPSSQSLHDLATFDQQSTAEEEASIYVQYNQLLHGDSISKEQHLFSTQFLKKYLLYAKHRVNPRISQEAAAYIAKAYSDLRAKEDMKTLPVTPRTLDAMLRLTVAHAKCRLSQIATEEDARVALEIMSYALYHEVSHSTAPQTGSNDTEDEIELSVDENEESSANNADEILPTIGIKRKRNQDSDAYDIPQAKVARPSSQTSGDVSKSQSESSISPSRAEEFGKLLVKFMTSRHLSECDLLQLCTKVNTLRPTHAFESQEALAAVKYLEKNGKLLYREGTVHLF